jgi:hypothetical protein
MTGRSLLLQLAAALDAAGIPWMLTGSLAAARHGAPRATRDIDLVVEATAPQLRRLVADLVARGLYASVEAALEASATEGMFNVIDSGSGWKADLILRKNRPFSVAEFSRRQTTVVEGTALSIATLEDVMLSKLEWARAGGSDRQVEDVAALVRTRVSEWDEAYVRRWVEALGLGAEWERAQALATDADRGIR